LPTKGITVGQVIAFAHQLGYRRPHNIETAFSQSPAARLGHHP